MRVDEITPPTPSEQVAGQKRPADSAPPPAPLDLSKVATVVVDLSTPTDSEAGTTPEGETIPKEKKRRIAPTLITN
jgi:hypothetical protein